MQIRKLVKSGDSSLVVAVPRDWIKQNKLKPGDHVYISDECNKLVIESELKNEPEEKKECFIEIDGKNLKIIKKEITSAYLNGAFYINVSGRELNKYSKIIKKYINEFIALEVVEETAGKIIARSFLNIYDVDLKLLIRRLDNIIRSMMADTKEVLSSPELAQNIAERDVEVNRLYFLTFKILKTAYLRREVFNSMCLKELDILKYWEANIHLEKIADRTKNIAGILHELDKKEKANFIKLFCEIEEVYRITMKGFHSCSIQEADEATLKKDDVLASIQKYIKANRSAACSQIAINAFNMISNINDINRLCRELNS